MVAVQAFLTQFHWFFCWLNSLFKDKLAYILTFVFFNSCIYFIVLLLLNVNLHSCMYCSIRNTKNNKKLSDWFQGLVLGPFFVLFFLQYFWKKICLSALILFTFLETIKENFLMQLNGNKDIKEKHLILTFMKNEFPIVQFLPFFRVESLQFNCSPA